MKRSCFIHGEFKGMLCPECSNQFEDILKDRACEKCGTTENLIRPGPDGGMLCRKCALLDIKDSLKKWED